MQPQNLVQKRTHSVENYWEMWWDCRVRGGIEHMQQLNECQGEESTQCEGEEDNLGMNPSLFGLWKGRILVLPYSLNSL